MIDDDEDMGESITCRCGLNSHGSRRVQLWTLTNMVIILHVLQGAG